MLPIAGKLGGQNLAKCLRDTSGGNECNTCCSVSHFRESTLESDDTGSTMPVDKDEEAVVINGKRLKLKS